MHSQMSRIASHNFQNQGAVMRTGSQIQTVNGIHANLNGRVETNRKLGNRSIVVNGFGNADHFNSGAFAIVAADVHAAVAADDNQSVKPQFAGAFAEFLRKGFHGFELNPAVERTEVGTAQARPRRIGKTGFGQHFVFKRAVGEPVGAEFDAVNFPAFERGGVNEPNG